MSPFTKVAVWLAALLANLGPAASPGAGLLASGTAAKTADAPPLRAPEVVVTAAPPRETIGAPRKKLLGSGEIYFPASFSDDDGAYDLVIHFHGTPLRTEPSLEEAGLDAVLFTVNLGNGSGPYEDAFEAKGSFDALLAKIDKAVRALGPSREPHVRNIALSAWSAGYGAVVRILSRQADAARVDAVLLADGMHAGLVGRHTVDKAGMTPFTRFAERAAAGDRLMAITHSSIVPDRHAYASTTETAEYLLAHVGANEETVHDVGPRKMVLVSKADLGGLHVRGFEGETAPAHCDHLIAIGKTLFPYLAERWASR